MKNTEIQIRNAEPRDSVRGYENASRAELWELRRKAVAAGVPEWRLEPGFEKRVIEMTGSDDSLDRYNSRILVDGKIGGRRFGAGWQLANFRKNPVFMPAHDYTEWPIGQALDVYGDQVGSGKNARKRLRFLVFFADEKENPLADKILKLYRGNFLRAASVGFIPKRAAYFPETDDEAVELGLPVGNVHPQPRLLPENELLELSAVPIPGNPNVADEKSGACFELTAEEVRSFNRLADESREVAPVFSYQLRSAVASTRRASVFRPARDPAAAALQALEEAKLLLALAMAEDVLTTLRG